MLASIFASPQILLLLLIIVVLFGSTRLPGLMRNLGRSAVEFKKGLKEVDEATSDEDDDDESKGKPKGKS